ncbi:MAG: hypothetical protein H0Z24_10135 [Thermosipho sp. (in: Bacteria)]|nr:hypothetical protein [Thermosipho sp. (in: thermotogales)]
METKPTLSQYIHRIYFISLILFLFFAITTSFLRLYPDLENMKVKIIFQNDPTIFFYSDNKDIPTNAKYIIIKDSTSINIDNFLKKLGEKKLGVLEFNISENISKEIAKRLPQNQIINVHYVKPEETLKYNEKTLFKRLWRAVIERSIDLIIIPETALTKSVYNEFISYFHIEEPTSYIPGNFNNLTFGIILGIFVTIYFPYAILGFLTIYFSYPLYISIMSILGTVILYFKIKDHFLKFFGYFTLGILTNLSLYDFEHLNNLEVYRGVKISLTLLPFILIILFIIKNKHEIKGAIKILVPIFLIFGIYYIIRSGNYGFVLDYEKQFREFIENLFIIRPRTKELLFYPLLLISTQITNKLWKSLLEIAGSISLVSTFNTFCHIRAPLFINIYREIITILIAFLIFGLVKIFIKRGEINEPEKNANSSYSGASH